MWESALKRALTLELSGVLERRLVLIFSSSKDYDWGFPDGMEYLWLEYKKARDGRESEVFEVHW